MSAILQLEDAVVQRGGRPVLAVDSLAVEEGELLTIIGPNGSGKSTLLLVLGGLLRADTGRLRFRGQIVRPADGLRFRRQLALILQDPLLLDATVEQNVATGLRFRGFSRRERATRVAAWLDRLGIADLAGRPARQLSGGEAQRVNLARALVLEPVVLLLDEPFAALDAPTRMRLIEEFRALQAELRTTTVFITHDRNEALALGDRLAVMLSGRLRQTGSPAEVFAAPADEEVAAFVGMETVVDGVVVAGEGQRLTIAAGADGRPIEAVGELPAGRRVMCFLRPEDVTLWAGDGIPPSSARNRLAGTVVRLSPQGPLVQVVLDCGFRLTALITRVSAEELGLVVGGRATATFKASAVHLIPHP